MHAFWLVLTYDLLEYRRIDDVIIKTFFPYILILYYIKQIDSKLPCVCSVIDHRGRQNVVRTSVTHSAAPCVPLLCSYHTQLKKWGEILDYVLRFSLHFVRALAASCVLYNRTEHSLYLLNMQWFYFLSIFNTLVYW